MPRLRPRVLTSAQLADDTTRLESNEPAVEDGYISRLVKYIPTEAIATHQAMAGFYDTDTAGLIGWFSVALLPMAVYWYFVSTKEKGEKPSWSQVVLTPLSFAIWLLVLRSPAVEVLFHRQLLSLKQGSIVLIFATGVIPMLGNGIDVLVKAISSGRDRNP